MTEPLQVLIYKDGNQVCALIGTDIQEGFAGFGGNIPAALKDLARELEEAGVVEELERSYL